MLLLLFLSLVQAQPVQSAKAPETGTAIVRGRVTEKESGRPLARALVTLWLNNPGRMIQNLTTEDGRFEFMNIPAGRVSLSAAAGEYSGTHPITNYEYVSERGRRVSTIVLKDAEVRENADIAMPRGLAISGRVVDDRGDPLARVRIRLERLDGQLPGSLGPSRETDDRGQFRHFGLAAGSYIVCADLDGLPSIPGFKMPPRPRLVPTCYPSAAAEAAAEPVILTTSDADGIEIRVRRMRTFSISGVVVGASGGPPDGASLYVTSFRGTGSGTTPAPLRADGSFSISDLVPGSYILHAGMSLFGKGPPRADMVRAELPVQIDTEDVTGVVLPMRVPARVSGQVTFDDPSSRLAEPLRVTIEARRNDGFFDAQRPLPSELTPELTFELTNLIGPMVVSIAGLPRGWIVKEVRYRGRDITDVPTEFRTGNDAIEIALTNRGAVVAGRVTGETNDAAKNARVMIFPLEPARRKFRPDAYAHTVSADGRFSLPPLRASDYLVIAVSYIDGRYFRDRKALEVLAKYAERVTLLEGERREMDLRVVMIGDQRRSP
jgi:hypothetical protein